MSASIFHPGNMMMKRHYNMQNNDQLLRDIKMLLILSMIFGVLCSRAFQASETYSNETIKVEDAAKEARFASVCVSETCLLQADTVLSHMDAMVRH